MSKKKLILSLIMFCGFTLSLNAQAYLPSNQFVFDRVAELHGKGVYKINQEVIFKDNAETHIIKETWIIVDGGEMLLQATGEDFQVTRLFKKGKIHSDKTIEAPVDYFMQALTMRNAGELKKLFFKWGILPADALKEKNIPRDLKYLKLESEKFVRLGRVNGAVQYQYGQLDGPSLWIEQDQFFITKIRTPSGAELSAQDYVIFSRGFAYPKLQTVSFNNQTVEIKTTGVYGINLTQEMKKNFEPTFLKNKENIAPVLPKHTLSKLIEEFYKRFR